ncbi:MAG: 4-(cytidine 5'-diphospho)-2-C-methyl-D-erythritol kinase [FCB group bacterium]|nr:4-(cytidine 5'-diphospho)-2-C-methyl-D-erythritol kinase [FCB group bacterium]
MITLQSYAKINIGLRILGRRPEDGYHLLETIFQEVDLADVIRIETRKRRGTFGERFSMSCDDPAIPCDGKNLIMQAIDTMMPFLPQDLGLNIRLQKRIPVGAGLGGGSSNAAAILRWLNREAGLQENELSALAVRIGADVPFFLHGGTAYATGIGEVLRPIGIPKSWFAVLVFPGIGISTAWAYGQLRNSLTAKPKKAIIPSQLENEFSWQIFENDFEKAIIPSYPEIGSIKERLYESGVSYAGLSGSGSTVFGVCETCDAAERVAAAFVNAKVVRPL